MSNHHIPVDAHDILIFFPQLLDRFIEKVVKEAIVNYSQPTSRELWRYQPTQLKEPVAVTMFKPHHVEKFAADYFWRRHNDANVAIAKSIKEQTPLKPIPLYAESFAKALEYIGYKNSKFIPGMKVWPQKANELYEQFKATNQNAEIPKMHDDDFGVQMQNDIDPSDNFIQAREPVRFGELVFDDIRLIAGLSDRCKFYFDHHQEKVRLPDDLLQLKSEWTVAHKKTDKKQIEDYPILGITAISHKFQALNNTREYYIQTKESSNYNRHAVSLSLDTQIPGTELTVRQKYFKPLIKFPGAIYDDFLISAFGVNLTIETSDGKIVLQKKRSKFTLTENNKLHVGLGVQLVQHGPDNVDLEQFAYDNLKRQYFIKKTETENLKFYTVAFGSAQCIYGAFGYVKLKFTFDKLYRRLQHSSIGERFEIFAMPSNLTGIRNYITEKRDFIINQYALFGALTSLQLFSETSILEIEEAFSGNIWRDFSRKISEKRIEFTLDDLKEL